MRFEIRTGGAFLILIGLIGLSGAVFGLGLVAGYQMARQTQPDLSQTSTTYPLPSAPTDESKPPPVAQMSPPAAPPVAAMQPSPATVARIKPPPPAVSTNPAAAGAPPMEAEADTGPPTSPVAPASPRRPYNIQIEAVMDKSAADEMVSRLEKLGYNAQELTTTLNGQIMYRVRVGPYYSADEASAAQAKLHEQYRQAYSTTH